MSIVRIEEVATTKLSKPPTPPLPKTNIVKQGLVSILGSDTQRVKSSAASIRRAFSADMSSKKWLTQNGFFSPIKKIASSKDLLLSSSSEEEEEEEELERRKSSFDIWSSILSQKKDEMSNLQTPYIHPLVKRSTSSLSDESFQIVTENLGSENGSDGFSSYTPSENGDVDEERDYHHQQQQQQYNSQFLEELRVVKYNYNKRSSSFPPPIPSLARGDNNPSLHMHSRREDGRLILEAVYIPPRNLFHAHRHDGRLLLTLVDDSTSNSSLEQEMEDYGEEFDEVFDDIDDHTPQFDYKNDDCPEHDEKNGIIVMKQSPILSNVVKNMKTSALMTINIREKSIQFPMGTKLTYFSLEMEGHLGLENKNLVTRLKMFNKVVNLTSSVDSAELSDDLSQITSIPQSLPTQLTPTTAASFNAYDYFWRKNPTIAKECNNYVASSSTTPNAKSTTKVAAYMNYLVPLQRGCKEPKRSLLIWEPYCIATS